MSIRAARWLVVGLSVALTGAAAPAIVHTLPELTSIPATMLMSQPPAPRPQPQPPRPPIDPTAVTAAVQQVEPSATVGVLVLDRETGAELLAIEPDRPFRSASLVKLLIAISTLTNGADDRVRNQIQMMLRVSDDDIGSLLWDRAGGPGLVVRTGAELGLTAAAPPSPPGRWGNVPLTARDIGRIYQFVLTGMPLADRELIVNAMADAPRFADDGFDQHFGIPSALPGPWAIKQGWSNSATDIVVHTSGLVGPDWRYVVVVLTEHPLGVSWRTAAGSVTAGTQALSPLL
jgi:hypothetical protein